VTLSTADLRFRYILECLRAEGCYFDTSSKTEEAAFNLRFQHHIRAGVGHLDPGNLALTAKIRCIFPAAGGTLQQTAFLYGSTAMEVLVIIGAFLASRGNHSDREAIWLI
jgi:hypothetical protein